MQTLIDFNYCVENHQNENGKCVISLYETNTSLRLDKKCSKYVFIDDCTDSAKLQLSVNDYQMLMGISSSFVGFTFMFFTIMLITFIARK